MQDAAGAGSYVISKAPSRTPSWMARSGGNMPAAVTMSDKLRCEGRGRVLGEVGEDPRGAVPAAL